MGAAWAVARPTVAGLVPEGTYGELSMPESPLGELTLGVWVRGMRSNTSTSLCGAISTWARAPRSSFPSTPG